MIRVLLFVANTTRVQRRTMDVCTIPQGSPLLPLNKSRLSLSIRIDVIFVTIVILVAVYNGCINKCVRGANKRIKIGNLLLLSFCDVFSGHCLSETFALTVKFI
jgi:hypothetical protein